MKKKRMIVMLLQFLLVIVSVGGIIYYMNSQTETTQVFIYTRNFLEPNELVTEADIRQVTIPSVAVSNGFTLDRSEIVGKYVQSAVYAGQYVYGAQLSESEQEDIFDTLDLTTYRRISLPIDMVEGLSGNMRRGDLIDLVYTGKGKKQADDLYSMEEFTYSKTFLQNVLVYSVNTADGYLFQGYADVEEGSAIDENGNPIRQSKMGIITLAVTLPQVEEIYARSKVGDISFIGRFGSSLDMETLGHVIGDYSPLFSGEAPVEISDINVFRGEELPAAPSIVIPEETGDEE